MAGDDSGVADSSCKYCRKTVDLSGPKCLCCVKCNGYYHSSCAARKNPTNVDIERNLIICGKCNESAKSEENQIDNKEAIYQVEIRYLKLLLKEKDDLIIELKSKNELLVEKTSHLERQKSNSYADKTSYISDKNKIADKEKNVPSEPDSDKNVPKQSFSAISKNVLTAALVHKQNQTITEVINLDKDMPKLTDGYTLVTNKRAKKKATPRVTRGTATDGDGFISRPSRMWVYVGRADESVTEAKVDEYIRKKCEVSNTSDLVVKTLMTKGRSPSFQVGIHPRYYETLLKDEFWPSGILVRRFNFRNDRKQQKEGEINFQQNPQALVTT